MSLALPELVYGKVVGRFLLAVGDASDADRTPDPQVPTNLKVTFTPAIPSFKVVEPPVTIFPKPIVCTLDEQGNIIDSQGGDGVWLIAGTYRVSYAGGEISLPQHDIIVTGANTDAAPVNLTNAAPAPVVPTPTQYAELNARLIALEGGGGGGAPAEHTHEAADVTDFAEAVDARIPAPVDTSDFVSSADVTAIDVMTQDAYNALAVKDPTTLYVIQG